VRRRLLAAIAALVLACAGAYLLLSYVRGADARALAGVETVDLLVVTAPVPEGTTAEDLGRFLAVEAVPAKLAAVDSLASLQGQAGRVTTTTLQPGEQLLASRLADPATLVAPDHVDVPAGMQEVTISLEPQRALGGHLAAGDRVGVFLTAGDVTHLTLQKVLLTRVQGAVPTAVAQDPAAAADGATPAAATPAGQLVVTLAVPGPDAEQVVWAMEHGSVWLSLQPAAAGEDGTRVVTGAEALR
jgi:pilus assembly protein CpaB